MFKAGLDFFLRQPDFLLFFQILGLLAGVAFALTLFLIATENPDYENPNEDKDDETDKR